MTDRVCEYELLPEKVSQTLEMLIKLWKTALNVVILANRKTFIENQPTEIKKHEQIERK